MSLTTYKITIILGFLLTLPSLSTWAQGSSSLTEEIAQASLEELLTMTITSVAKVPEELRTAPSAIAVVTSEDIRRRGVTSVMEALRGVPGVNVAKQEQNKWAISIRGFNHRNANKILVLLDGRSIYDPLFSGTFWEVRDVFLEDVERIEVIRGPGGSAWGANAVNGVINILSKHSKDTQGGLVSAGGGNEDHLVSGIRYGGKISDETFYRIYSRYVNRDSGYREQGASDDSYNGHAGFRVDSELGKDEHITVQGSIFDGTHDGVTGIFNTLKGEGGVIQAGWQKQITDASLVSLNAYFDYFDFDAGIVGEKRRTGEMNLQEEHYFTDWFSSIVALQYRYSTDHIASSEIFSLDPVERTDHLIGASLTGKFSLIKDILEMRAGAKVDHNDYSGVEVQPDAGLSWTINPVHTIWASVARAVRIPARLENDFVIKFPGTEIIAAQGNRRLNAEDLIAYQVGHHMLASDNILLSTTAFYNTYRDLILGEGTSLRNNAEGDTYGGELALTWTPQAWWKIQSAYSYIEMDIDLYSDSISDRTIAVAQEGNTPQNQLMIYSSFDLSQRWELDLAVRYVDHLKALHVASYVVADVRLGFQYSKDLELSIIGQNLFNDHHFEQGSNEASQVEEAIFGKVVWTF